MRQCFFYRRRAARLQYQKMTPEQTRTGQRGTVAEASAGEVHPVSGSLLEADAIFRGVMSVYVKALPPAEAVWNQPTLPPALSLSGQAGLQVGG